MIDRAIAHKSHGFHQELDDFCNHLASENITEQCNN